MGIEGEGIDRDLQDNGSAGTPDVDISIVSGILFLLGVVGLCAFVAKVATYFNG